MRELPAEYTVKRRGRPSAKLAREESVINEALSIVYKRLRKPTKYSINNPKSVIDLLQIILAEEEKEVFTVLYFNSQHQFIEACRPFTGTIDGASVYPREVVKHALKVNAAAVIFSHNHPSGHSEASLADQIITKKLTEALGLIDVRVLDHIIIAGETHLSFAEAGLL